MPQYRITPRNCAREIDGTIPSALAWAGTLIVFASCAAICAPAESPARKIRSGSMRSRSAFCMR